MSAKFLFISWLQDHLLSCPFKYLTGLDCPLCGFQRSVLELMKGNFCKSFMLYPTAIPLLTFFAYKAIDLYFKLDTSQNHIKRTSTALICAIVALSYGIKLWNVYHR